MASISEIEGMLSMLGTGIAGLRFLKEYNIRTSELKYFIENFSDGKIEVSAFAPPPLRNQYEKVLSKIEAKLVSGVKKISSPNVSRKTVDKVLKDAKELYSLLNDIHQATISGIIIA